MSKASPARQTAVSHRGHEYGASDIERLTHWRHLDRAVPMVESTVRCGTDQSLNNPSRMHALRPSPAPDVPECLTASRADSYTRRVRRNLSTSQQDRMSL